MQSNSLHEAESFLEQLIFYQLVYWNRRFIAAFTTALRLSLSWARSIHYTTSTVFSWKSILLLSSQLHLGLPSGLFPSGFTTRIMYPLLLFPIRATWPAHLTLLDLITVIICSEQYRFWSSSLCSLLQSPVALSLWSVHFSSKSKIWLLGTALNQGELSYLAPLGSENISAPYFKQCFFQGWGVLPP